MKTTIPTYSKVIATVCLLLCAFSLSAQKLTVQSREFLTLCQNQKIEYKGIKITSPGTYYDTLYSSKGVRDSLVQIVVNIAPSYLIETHASIRTGETYRWLHNGETYSKAGIYYDNQQTALGCDSVFCLVLEWKVDYYGRLDTTICESELPFTWNGRRYYSAVKDTVLTHSSKADSLFVLDLKIDTRKITEQTLWLCGDEEFIYNDVSYKSGIIADTFLTTYGCDSINRIYLNRAPVYLFSDTVNLYDLTADTWRGQTITKAGVYTDPHTSQYGCDSTYQLVVYNYPSYYMDTTVAVCHNEIPYLWRGKKLYEAGVYEDKFKTVSGKDSIYRIDFKVNTVAREERYIELCEGDYYDFRGRRITGKGVYIDTLFSNKGCDSIVTLVVNRVSNYVVPTYVEMCDGDFYDFHGRKITENGVYYDTIRNISGCDSIEKLIINFYDIPYTYEQAIVCPGDEYQYRGKLLSEQGVYIDTLLNYRGCDSIHTLVLNVGNAYLFHDTLHKATEDTVYWHGQKIVAAGTYYDRLTSTTGCDSVWQLEAYTHASYHFQDIATICEKEQYYEWQNGRYAETGVYTVQYRTIYGTDSIYTLDLTVNPTVRENTYYYICRGDKMTYKGRVIDSPVTFEDSLLTSTGCDSIVTVIVNETPSYFFEADEYMHAGGTFVWHDITLTEAGVYYDSLTTYLGCDSIFKLTLHTNPVYYFVKDTAICANDLPYDLNGHRLIYSEGTYYDSLTTFAGVDSVYRLNLIVWDSPLIEKQLWGCSGEGIQYRDTVFYEPTVYYDSLLTYHGCDSVIKVVTNFTPRFVIHQHKHICEGDEYVWRDRTCDRTGVYTDSLTTEHGCDSIYVLHMTVHRSTLDTTQAVICEAQAPYKWRGHNYYETGIYTDSLLSPYGCDSVFRLDLTVNKNFLQVEYHDICEGDFIVVSGDTVTESGIFDKTYYTADGCDSIYRTIITVKATDTIKQTRTICANDTFLWRGQSLTRANIYMDAIPYADSRGLNCDSVVFWLDLQVKEHFLEPLDTIVCRDSLPFIWRDRMFWKDTLVADTFVNELGCDSIYSLNLLIAKCSEPDTFYLCPDGMVEVRGKEYDTIGRYYVQAGPDSIYRFRILNADTFRIRKDTTICSSTMPLRLQNLTVFADQLTFGGKVNVIDQKLKSVHGCDSTIEWHIKAYKSDTTVRQVSICNDDSYFFRHRLISNPGVYYDTLFNINGCDSVIKLILNKQETAFVDESVNIIIGGSYLWRGKEYYYSGSYYDTLRYTSSGCDSVVYRLNLTVSDGYYKYDTLHICSNKLPYIWFNRPITETGNYVQRYTTVNGTDSIYNLRLIVDSAAYTTRTYQLCNNEYYDFNSRTITEPGVYRDTLLTTCGCDSIVTLVVNKAPTAFREIKLRTCEGEPYFYKNKRYDAPCVFYDTLITSFGCDSIVRFVLNAYPTYATDRYDTIREGETYTFDGQTIHLPGTYYQRAKTYDTGCDSIIRLHLYVHSAAFHEDTITICYGADGFPYIHNRKEYRTSTVIKDTMVTAQGYDSIVWTHLVVYPRVPETRVKVTLCNNDVFQLRGQNITIPGNYYDTLQAHTGCDSVIHYVVNRAQTYFFHQEVSFCENRGYTWRGHHGDIVLKRPGIYYDSLQTQSGCDSIYELNLVAKGAYMLDTTILLCYDELPYMHEGRLYYTSETFEDVFPSLVTGCDSIRIFKYIVTNKCSEVGHVYKCTDQPYHVGAVNIDTVGLYRIPQWTNTGLDSLYRFRLDTVQPTAEDISAVLCYGDSLFFEGRYYKTAGHYPVRLTSQFGCDSVRTLHLTTTTPPELRQSRTTIADYELPYAWRGNLYYEAGTYVSNVYNASTSCVDTAYQLLLSVITTAYDTLTYNICRGDSVAFAGEWYKQNTVTSDTLPYLKYGRSQVTFFNLTVQDSTHLESLYMKDDCADASELVAVPVYSGVRPQTYSLQFVGEKARLEGFSDIVEEPFTGEIRIPMPQQKMDTYVTPGEYRVRLTLSNGVCGTVVQETTFTIKYPSWIMEQNWGNVIALLNDKFNGGYRFTGYKWSVLGKKNIVSTQPYLQSDFLQAGDTVIVSLAREGEGFVPSCPFIVKPYEGASHAYPILVYPTAAPRRNTLVTVKTEKQGTCCVYDYSGHLINTVSIEGGEQSFALPQVSGCYLLVFRMNGGEVSSERVIVY